MDSNDVQFNEYSVDFFGFLKLLFSGGSGGSDAGSGGVGPGFQSGTSAAESAVANFIDFLASFWSVLVVFSWLLTALLIFGIIYAYIRAQHYGDLQSEMITIQERLYKELYGKGGGNRRWDDVLAHIATDTPKDWRLAILEADILLDETLKAAGFAGNTIGLMLKSVTHDRFNTLDQAWAAHLVRNKVAHSGSDFILTKKLAQETITQYRMVFEEFGVV